MLSDLRLIGSSIPALQQVSYGLKSRLNTPKDFFNLPVSSIFLDYVGDGALLCVSKRIEDSYFIQISELPWKIMDPILYSAFIDICILSGY